MAKSESLNSLNVDFMRSLVKQYSELGQWSSALFWADAAAAVGSGSGVPNGDDMWLMANTMLAQGEHHRAAHTITSRGLHRNHLLCLGVAMRANLAAREPAAALSLLDEVDAELLERRSSDPTHNRALAGVLVWQARALSALQRREAAAETLAAALRADTACYEAFDLLLDQHTLTPKQGIYAGTSKPSNLDAYLNSMVTELKELENGLVVKTKTGNDVTVTVKIRAFICDSPARALIKEVELVESLPIHEQLRPCEAALLKGAYMELLNRYSPVPRNSLPSEGTRTVSGITKHEETPQDDTVEAVRSRTRWSACLRARRLAAGGEWKSALRVLESRDALSLPGACRCCAPTAVACLVQLRRAAQLFALAHALVDAYPEHWASWYAVGCYYYLVGKSELARRYLCKAKSLEPGAGCVWLAYGHSFVAENEHDLAMAAYFKASQLMAGCYLPPLYVGVECSLLNNVASCQKFLLRAALLHSKADSGAEAEAEALWSGGDTEAGGEAAWDAIARVVRSAQVAHEAGAAALAAGQHAAAERLLRRALECAETETGGDDVAATLDALGHACRRQGRAQEALAWHERAVAARPARAASLCAAALCLSALRREQEAADVLHAALARDPDDTVALALLNLVVDRLLDDNTEKDYPRFPFPKTEIIGVSGASGASGSPEPQPLSSGVDITNTSDMSMSFE